MIGRYVFLWGYWYYYFGHLLMSTLEFNGQDRPLTCVLAQIHLWCENYWASNAKVLEKCALPPFHPEGISSEPSGCICITPRPGGGRQPIIYPDFPQKLHEKERRLIQRGAGLWRPLRSSNGLFNICLFSPSEYLPSFWPGPKIYFW